jgi:hypothetical protein
MNSSVQKNVFFHFLSNIHMIKIHITIILLAGLYWHEICSCLKEQDPIEMKYECRILYTVMMSFTNCNVHLTHNKQVHQGQDRWTRCMYRRNKK